MRARRGGAARRQGALDHTCAHAPGRGSAAGRRLGDVRLVARARPLRLPGPGAPAATRRRVHQGRAPAPDASLRQARVPGRRRRRGVLPAGFASRSRPERRDRVDPPGGRETRRRSRHPALRRLLAPRHLRPPGPAGGRRRADDRADGPVAGTGRQGLAPGADADSQSERRLPGGGRGDLGRPRSPGGAEPAAGAVPAAARARSCRTARRRATRRPSSPTTTS